MKAKSGFILRNIVEEYIVIPTGDTINEFKGTLLLNELSAFIWEKLQAPVTRDELLAAILNEYDVEEQQAAADLDALLEKLRGYDMLTDE